MVHPETTSTPPFINKKTVGELYQRYGRRLYAYAVHTWKTDSEDAWDMVYKTLYRVNETHERYTFADESRFDAFVFRVFMNYLRNLYRDTAQRREQLKLVSFEDLPEHATTSGATVEPESSSAEPVTESASMQLLRHELGKLEDWQRVLLLMRTDGRPYAEIASFVSKPEDQLKVYYQRLKKALAAKLYGKS